MKGKPIIFTETLVSSLEPERTFRLADECLVEIRLIESRNESSAWIYEYEISGEGGKIAKFLSRVKSVEIGD